MPRIILLAWLALSLCVPAAVTVAWKLPIERLAPDYETSSTIRKLDKPPARSAFFQPGDVLWDVSKAWPWPQEGEAVEEADPFDPDPDRGDKLPDDWEGEWVVWNSRSGMFVARGSWGDIRRVERGIKFAERPTLLHTTVQWEEAGKQVASLSLVTRSGEESSFSADGRSLKLTVVGSASQWSRAVDMAAAVAWPGKEGGSRWEVLTGVTLMEGKRARLARQGSGADAWELFATVTKESVEGTAHDEARWIEMGGQLHLWKHPVFGERNVRKRLDADRIVAVYSVPPTLVSGIDEDKPNLGLREVPAPEHLGDLIAEPLLDAAETLRSNGVDVSGQGFYAGYHPATFSLVVVGDAEVHDFCEAMFPVSRRLPGIMWISTNESFGSWGLTARSGERARIVRTGGDGELLFEIEPTLGGNGHVMDLALKADIVQDAGSRGRLDSTVTLWADRPLTIGRRAAADGVEMPLEVSATVIPYVR